MSAKKKRYHYHSEGASFPKSYRHDLRFRRPLYTFLFFSFFFFFKRELFWKKCLLFYCVGLWHHRWMWWYVAVEVEPSHQYSIMFWCHVTAAEGLSDRMVFGMEVCVKNPFTFINTRWTFMETKQWIHSEVVAGVFQ